MVRGRVRSRRYPSRRSPTRRTIGTGQSQDRSPILIRMSIVRLRWLYAVQGAALGLLLPYLVPLMAGRGLSATEIGLVLGASGLVSLASYPMWGALADGPLGRRRAIGATASVAVIGGLWVVAAGSDPVVLAGAVSLTLAGAVPWGAISDAIALNSLGDRSG